MGIPDSAEPVGIPSSFVESTINDTAALYAMPSNSHRPSMLLDSMKGRPMEVESILGEVVRTARELAVPVPVSVVFRGLLRGRMGCAEFGGWLAHRDDVCSLGSCPESNHTKATDREERDLTACISQFTMRYSSLDFATDITSSALI